MRILIIIICFIFSADFLRGEDGRWDGLDAQNSAVQVLKNRGKTEDLSLPRDEAIGELFKFFAKKNLTEIELTWWKSTDREVRFVAAMLIVLGGNVDGSEFRYWEIKQNPRRFSEKECADREEEIQEVSKRYKSFAISCLKVYGDQDKNGKESLEAFAYRAQIDFQWTPENVNPKK